jgi:hypothetical protein
LRLRFECHRRQREAFRKQPSQSAPTEAGRQIDESAEQFPNAQRPIDHSLEPASKVTIERERHSQKQAVQSRWTEEGTQIDESTEQYSKAEVSISESLEPNSNVTIERDRQRQKDL